MYGVSYTQVAEDAMRTQYELKKKERTSLLANLSLEQHAFSYNQKPPQFKIPDLPTSSGNIRERFDNTKDTSSSPTPKSVLTPMCTPSKSMVTMTGEGACGELTESPITAGTSGGLTSRPSPLGAKTSTPSNEPTPSIITCTEDDTQSCFHTTVDNEEVSVAKRKRKWYSIF